GRARRIGGARLDAARGDPGAADVLELVDRLHGVGVGGGVAVDDHALARAGAGAVFSLATVRTTWRSDPSATAAVMTIPGEALSIQATRAPDGEKRGTRCELAGVASRRTAGRELQSPSSSVARS